MKTIIKLKGTKITRLNNAEYTNLSSRMYSLTLAVTAEALNIEAEVITRYAALIAQMQDLVARSYALEESAEMEELDKQRDALGQYIIETVRSAQDLPIAAKSAAANSLFLVLKPYVGFYSKPVQQETVLVNGMITDLTKAENATHVQTLGLSEYVQELSLVNARYLSLTEQRTTSREDARTENSKTLRLEMDELYDYITTVSFCESVAKPTEATALFIKQLNAVIDETNTAYNQRMGHHTEEEEEEEEESV